jgi:hypothetical protein
MLGQEAKANAAVGYNETRVHDHLLAAMRVGRVRAETVPVAERIATRASKLECFVIRCWARAYLHAAGELSLHEAVDVLQEQAEASGLVHILGQDTVQAFMAREFGGR